MSSEQPFVLYEKSGQILRLTLNRPEKLNAFTAKDIPAFAEAFEKAESDDDIKIIIIRGAGKAFSAGYDMQRLGNVYHDREKEGVEAFAPQWAGDKHPPQRVRFYHDHMAFRKNLAKFYTHKITIAQIHGHVVGGAIDWIMLCDFIIAAEGTKLYYTPARMHGPGATTAIMEILRMGPALAHEMLWLGRKIDVSEIGPRGINSIVPLEKLEAEVERWALALALCHKDYVYMGKETMHRIYEILGVVEGFRLAAFEHPVSVQARLEPEEWNLFKERKEGGTKGATKSRDERYKDLGF